MLSSHLVVFYPCDFCAYQRGTVFEVLRTIFCPNLESLVVLSESIQVLSAILGSSRVPGCRSGKRTVEVIFRFLKKTGRGPDQSFRPQRSLQCYAVLASDITCLHLPD